MIYADIPLKIKYSLDNNLSGFYGGLNVGLKIDGSLEYQGQNYDADGLESIDLGYIIGISIQITNNMALDLHYVKTIGTITHTGTMRNVFLQGGIQYFLD